jgi:cysteinyl-tRNA synthetase
MARFWLHIGFLNVDNMKMSKSLGNFFMTREAAKKYGYLTIRYFLLSSHYRSPINFSAEILEQSSAALERLLNCSENMKFRTETASDRDLSEKERASIEFLEKKKGQFIEAMDDDFNTADAIGYLFEMAREINTCLAEQDVSKKYLDKADEIYGGFCRLFGFVKAEEDDSDRAYIEEMIAKRTTAKKAKDYALADAIRNELKEKGIILEDTPQGVKWKRA